MTVFCFVFGSRRVDAVGSSTLHLKVMQVSAEPARVCDHDVPVFTSEFSPSKRDYWDLTTKQVAIEPFESREM